MGNKFSPGEKALERSTLISLASASWMTIVVKAHNGNVVMKVRENCFTGVWKDSPLCV